MWISNFKLAVLNEDQKQIEFLSKTMPRDLEEQELKVAISLVAQALVLMKNKKNETSYSISKIKDIKKYILKP